MLAGPAIAEVTAIWQLQSAGARVPLAERRLRAGRRRTWRVAAARIKFADRMLRVRALDVYHAGRLRWSRKIDPSVTVIKTELS
jgi:hypothetical protein